MLSSSNVIGRFDVSSIIIKSERAEVWISFMGGLRKHANIE